MISLETDKRTHQNEMERFRRSEIKSAFDELRSVLPNPDSKISHTEMLSYAVDYIRSRKADIRGMLDNISELERENRRLQKDSKGSEKENCSDSEKPKCNSSKKKHYKGKKKSSNVKKRHNITNVTSTFDLEAGPSNTEQHTNLVNLDVVKHEAAAENVLFDAKAADNAFLLFDYLQIDDISLDQIEVKQEPKEFDFGSTSASCSSFVPNITNPIDVSSQTCIKSVIDFNNNMSFASSDHGYAAFNNNQYAASHQMYFPSASASNYNYDIPVQVKPSEIKMPVSTYTSGDSLVYSGVGSSVSNQKFSNYDENNFVASSSDNVDGPFSQWNSKNAFITASSDDETKPGRFLIDDDDVQIINFNPDEDVSTDDPKSFNYLC